MPASDQGISLERYMLIPRTLIFLTRGENVLLLRGAPQKRIWANRYNGVGGHIEPGEDFLSAARRELLEETGLTAENLRLCGIMTVDSGQNPGVGIFILRGECPNGEALASAEGTLEWVPFAGISRLPLVEDLPSLLPRVLAMQPCDPPFAVQLSYDEEQRLVITFGESGPPVST